MKTNEFIKAVEELGFTTATTKYSIRVNADGTVLVHVRKDLWLVLDICWRLGVNEQLFDLAFEYAKTPVDEREEPKKYYLRHKYLKGCSTFNFLNFNKGESSCLLSIKECNEKYQTEFTQEEIENLPFPVILSEWDLIEVQE